MLFIVHHHIGLVTVLFVFVFPFTFSLPLVFLPVLSVLLFLLPPAVIALMSELATVLAFVACEFVALRSPVASAFAMVAVRLTVGLMICNMSLEGLTGTGSWLVFHQINTAIRTIPIIRSHQMNLVLLTD